MAANIKGGNSAVVQRQQNPGAALGASIMESIKQLSEFVKSLNKNRKSNSDLIRLYGIVFKQALIILTKCMDDKNYNTNTIGCCLDLINDVFEKLDNKNLIDFDQVLWMINDRCVMIADKKAINIILLEKIIRYNTRFINFMLTGEVRRKGFFSTEHRGEVAFMITLLLDKFCSQTVDLPVRISAGNALLEVVKPWDESLEMITAFLPGICCRVDSLASTDLNVTVVNLALKIFGCTATRCFNDAEIKHSEAKLSFPAEEKNLDCTDEKEVEIDNFEKSRRKLKFLITRMCSRLVLHTDYRIRLNVLTVLYDIYSQCSVSLAPLIENVLIDCVILLLNDPYESISMLSAKIRDHLMQSLSSNFMNRLRDRLYALSNSLRNEVLAKGDVNGRLQQIHGVLLTLISGGGDIFPERKFSDQLAIAMASTLHLECKRLRLSKEGADITSNALELLDNLTLAYGVKNSTVHQIAFLLAKSDSPLMDCISAVVQRSESLDEQIGCYLFAAYLLRAADLENAIGICEKFFSTIGGMVDQAVSQLDRIDIHRKPRDDLIEDDNDEQGVECCLVVALLAFLAAALRASPSGVHCQQIMSKALFDLFKWTKSSHVICVESAECALRAAALASGETDVSSLCIKYGEFLLSKMTVCLRLHNNHHHRTPCVLSSVLDHCNSKQIFAITRDAAEELLQAVDRGTQEWLILTLRALLSFVVAVGKWYHDAVPEEIEFDENEPDTKPPKPAFVEVLNHILKRTKHLLFSPHIPVLLVALNIVDVALADLRNFPDDHLPMIHQNWPAILSIMQNKNLNARVSAFQVIITMGELSGGFIYRRFISETWPAIHKFMLQRCNSSANAPRAYFHSAAYRYQEIVLKNLPVVLQKIEARTVDWQSAEEVAIAYSNIAQPENFQNFANSLLETCQEKIREDGKESIS